MSKIAQLTESLLQEVPAVKKLAKFTQATDYHFLQKLYQGKRLNLKDKYPHRGETKILDLYPGLGFPSLALYETLNPKQQLLLDTNEKFNEFIDKNLQMVKTAQQPSKSDGNKFKYYHTQIPELSNMQHAHLNPYQWATYSTITNNDIATNKTVNPEKAIFLPSQKNTDKLHDEFLIHGNLTGLVCARYSGEALLMQLYGCVHRKNWMQRFGRAKMLFWVREATALKLIARPGDVGRSKASLIAETFTNTSLVAVNKNTVENPKSKRYALHPELIAKHNPVIFSDDEAKIVTEDKERIALIEIDPVTFPSFDFEQWDYVTRQLFVLHNHPLTASISTLGPGAKEWILPRLPKEWHDLKPTQLSKEAFLKIYEIFSKWPFKPDINLEFLDIYQDI
ncbi:hypothetical protein ACO0QE_000146 [Hanseniaspora vineae]